MSALSLAGFLAVRLRSLSLLPAHTVKLGTATALSAHSNCIRGFLLTGLSPVSLVTGHCSLPWKTPVVPEAGPGPLAPPHLRPSVWAMTSVPALVGSGAHRQAACHGPWGRGTVLTGAASSGHVWGLGARASRGLEVTALPPGSSHTCTLWRALASEPSLTAQVLGLLLQKMSKDVPFKESRAFLLSSSPDRVATLLPLTVSGGCPTAPSPRGGGNPRVASGLPHKHPAPAW